VSFSANVGLCSLRTDYSSGFVRFCVRVRKAKQTKTDTRKSSVYPNFGGRNGLFVQLRVRPVASLPGFLSFVSWGIRSSR